MLQKHTRISLQGSWVYRKLNVLELQNVCSHINNKKKRRFHCKVRGFIEKEIVQLECGRGSPACMQEISKLLVSASAGLETLRRIYTGDMHTQNILGQTVKELALTAKMSQSYLARRKGETSRLVT